VVFDAVDTTYVLTDKGLEVLAAVVMKSNVFLDIMSGAVR
jgi:hypothetical protein